MTAMVSAAHPTLGTGHQLPVVPASLDRCPGSPGRKETDRVMRLVKSGVGRRGKEGKRSNGQGV